MTAFIAILVTGMGTYAMRAVFIVALANRRFPPMVLRTLGYVAPAVMGALVVSLLIDAQGAVSLGAPELMGLATTALLAVQTRNHIITLLGGMAAFWLMGWALG